MKNVDVPHITVFDVDELLSLNVDTKLETFIIRVYWSISQMFLPVVQINFSACN